MDIKSIKAEAKKTLYSKGNHTHLVLLCILTAFAIMIPVLIYAYSASLLMILFDNEGENIFLSYILPAILTLICAIFISFPAISGVYLCGKRIYGGERFSLIEGYTENYKKNLAFGAILILRWIPAIAAFILSLILPSLISEKIMGAMESTLTDFNSQMGELAKFIDVEWLIYTLLSGAFSIALLIAAALITLAIIALSGRLFLFPYFISNGYEIKEAFKSSKNIMRKPQNKRNHSKFLLSFIGLLCLSLLTLGLLLIFYTGPLMLMTYNTLAEEMADDNETIYQ